MSKFYAEEIKQQEEIEKRRFGSSKSKNNSTTNLNFNSTNTNPNQNNLIS